MAVELQVEFPVSAQKALLAQIRRAQDVMGKSAAASVKVAARHVVNSLGASTKQAPKKRKVEVKLTRTRVGKKVKTLREYGVMVWRKGAPVFAAVAGATSKSDVQKSPLVKIFHRGLAKASWKWIGKKVKTSVGTVAAGWMTEKLARGYVDVRDEARGNYPRITIRNRLKYIQSALIGGPAGVDDAMRRAASGMEKSITKQLETAAKVAEGKVTSAAFAASIVENQTRQDAA